MATATTSTDFLPYFVAELRMALEEAGPLLLPFAGVLQNRDGMFKMPESEPRFWLEGEKLTVSFFPPGREPLIRELPARWANPAAARGAALDLCVELALENDFIPLVIPAEIRLGDWIEV